MIRSSTYPCSEPLSVAKDCPISGDKLPLIVVSYGRGSSFLCLYDVAETLADAGFVVTVNHPGDTGSDRSRSDNLSAFVERPADIRRLIGDMLGASAAAAKIDPERIGFFGFSRSGHTGLVLIGRHTTNSAKNGVSCGFADILEGGSTGGGWQREGASRRLFLKTIRSLSKGHR